MSFRDFKVKHSLRMMMLKHRHESQGYAMRYDAPLEIDKKNLEGAVNCFGNLISSLHSGDL